MFVLFHVCTIPSNLSEDINNFLFSFSLRDAAVSKWSLGHFSPGCQAPRECFIISMSRLFNLCEERRQGVSRRPFFFFFFFFFFPVYCLFTQLGLVLSLSSLLPEEKNLFWPLKGALHLTAARGRRSLGTSLFLELTFNSGYCFNHNFTHKSTHKSTRCLQSLSTWRVLKCAANCYIFLFCWLRIQLSQVSWFSYH